MKTPTFNHVLSNAATEYANSTSGFIASLLFPTFPTAVQSGEFPIFKKENLLNIVKLKARAPGTPYQRINLELGKDVFATQDLGAAIPLDDRQKQIYASLFNAEVGKTTTLTRTMLVNKERRARELMVGSSSIIPNSVPTVKWDDTSADLIGDVKAVSQVIFENCGLKPNLITMPMQVWNTVCDHPSIVDRIKHTHGGSITEEMVAKLFGVKQLVVAETTENTAAEGLTQSISSIWGDDVIIAHVSSTLDLESPTFGRTFSFTKGKGSRGGKGEFGVMSHRDNDSHSMIHEMMHDVQEKIVAPACAYVLKDTLTT